VAKQRKMAMASWPNGPWVTRERPRLDGTDLSPRRMLHLLDATNKTCVTLGCHSGATLSPFPLPSAQGDALCDSSYAL
jgi:hypothetical protein